MPGPSAENIRSAPDAGPVATYATWREEKDHNILCFFHGHSHAAAIYQWRGLTVIADGSTAWPEHPPGCFFVVRITEKEFIAAHRLPEEWGVCIRKPLPAGPATVGPHR